MVGYYGHAAAKEYLRLNKDAEFNFEANKDQNGTLLYFVEAVCGSLECPPCVNGRELSCMVCNK